MPPATRPCALTGLDLVEARARMTAMWASLGAGKSTTTFSYGLALLGPEESAEQLVARADGGLYRDRLERSRSG